MNIDLRPQLVQVVKLAKSQLDRAAELIKITYKSYFL
jgi:hypothetical protein